MKKLTIFITNSKSGAFFEIANGWKNAFSACGHKTIMWDGNNDIWHQNNPDIYIGCSGWRQSLPKGHNAKVAIHVNPFCDEVIKSDGPVINESVDAINWTIAQRPLFVFGYALQDDMDRWWSKWKSIHKINIVGMPNAADVTIYKRIPPTQSLLCDVGWVGGYWTYKALNLDKYLIPVFRRHPNSLWFGWNGPKGLWSGKATAQQVLSLFSSAKICPCVVEPHTTQYGIDMPERIFKLAACEALVISDPVINLDKYFTKGSVAVGTDPLHYSQLCEDYIKMDDDTKRLMARKLTVEVKSKHTYFNRVRTFLNAFGYTEQASEYDTIIERETKSI